ncbi:MAG: hypothetical protein R2688_05160 [Fimbriimonadaceae bacterium]
MEVGEKNQVNFEILSGVKEGQLILKPEFSGPPRQGMMQFGGDGDGGGDGENSEVNPAKKATPVLSNP